MRVTVEQPVSEFALEILDPPAQRGRRHVQFAGRGGEVQFLGDGDEITQV